MPNPDAIFPVEIDTSRLNATLESLREALVGQGKDVSTILVDEQRKLTRTIVNFTAPIPSTNARWPSTNSALPFALREPRFWNS